MRKSRSLIALVLFSFITAAIFPAQAEAVRWWGSPSGDWAATGAASNWRDALSGGAVAAPPAAGQGTFINNNGAVNLTTLGALAGALAVGDADGDGTLNITGVTAALTTNGAINIGIAGGTGTVSMTNGEWNAGANPFIVGTGSNGRGELNLSNTAVLTAGAFTVGVAAATNASTGTININNSSVNADATTINDTGRLNIGSNGEFNATGLMLVHGRLDVSGNGVVDTTAQLNVHGRAYISENAVVDVGSVMVDLGGRMNVSGNSTIDATGNVVVNGTLDLSGNSVIDALGMTVNTDSRVYVRGTGVEFDLTLTGTGLFVLDHNTAWNLPGELNSLIANAVIPGSMRIGLYSGTITLNAIRNDTHSPMTVMNNATLVIPVNGITIADMPGDWLTLDGGTVRWGAGNTADYSTILNTTAGGILDLNGNNVTFASVLNVPIVFDVASIITVTGGGSLALSVAPIIAGDLRIEENTTLVLNANTILPAGARLYNYGTLVVEDGVTLTNNGSIINRGEVSNRGIVRNNFRIFSDEPIGGNFSGNPVESLTGAPDDPSQQPDGTPGEPGAPGAPGTPGTPGAQGPEGSSGCNSGAFGLGAFAGVLVFFKKKRVA